MQEENFNIYCTIPNNYYKIGMVQLISDIFESQQKHTLIKTNVNLTCDVVHSDLAIIHRVQGDNLMKCSVSDHIKSSSGKKLKIIVVPDCEKKLNNCVLDKGNVMPYKSELWIINAYLMRLIIHDRYSVSKKRNVQSIYCYNCPNVYLTKREMDVIYCESLGKPSEEACSILNCTDKAFSWQKNNIIKKLKLLNKVDYLHFILNHSREMAQVARYLSKLS